MASVTYGKGIMASVIMAKVLWQIKLSPLNHTIAEILCCVTFYCVLYVLCSTSSSQCKYIYVLYTVYFVLVLCCTRIVYCLEFRVCSPGYVYPIFVLWYISWYNESSQGFIKQRSVFSIYTSNYYPEIRLTRSRIKSDRIY